MSWLEAAAVCWIHKVPETLTAPVNLQSGQEQIFLLEVWTHPLTKYHLRPANEVKRDGPASPQASLPPKKEKESLASFFFYNCLCSYLVGHHSPHTAVVFVCVCVRAHVRYHSEQNTFLPLSRATVNSFHWHQPVKALGLQQTPPVRASDSRYSWCRKDTLQEITIKEKPTYCSTSRTEHFCAQLPIKNRALRSSAPALATLLRLFHNVRGSSCDLSGV